MKTFLLIVASIFLLGGVGYAEGQKPQQTYQIEGKEVTKAQAQDYNNKIIDTWKKQIQESDPANTFYTGDNGQRISKDEYIKDLEVSSEKARAILNTPSPEVANAENTQDRLEPEIKELFKEHNIARERIKKEQEKKLKEQGLIWE